MKAKLLAILAVLVLFLLIYLYTREFAIISNTLETGRLLLVSLLAGALVSGLLLRLLRKSIRPLQKHIPEWVTVTVLAFVFSPLLVSRLNRAIAVTKYVPFEFVREEAYYASAYGLLKGEKPEPTGYRLYVKQGTKQYRFKYKSQAYYPMTNKGEEVLLPIAHGFLGIRVMKLR